MSDIETKEFLRLVRGSFDLSTSIVRAYTNLEVINKLFNGSFIQCLDKIKHEMFHMLKCQQPCCACPRNTRRIIKKNKIHYNDKTFHTLYEFDNSISCNNNVFTGNSGKRFQNCLCTVKSRSVISLEDLDLPLLCLILNKNGIVHSDVEKLKDIRNKICHAKHTRHFQLGEYPKLWKKLENSIRAIAGLVDHNLHQKAVDQLNAIQHEVLDKGDIDQVLRKVDEVNEVIKCKSNDIHEHVTNEATKVTTKMTHCIAELGKMIVNAISASSCKNKVQIGIELDQNIKRRGSDVKDQLNISAFNNKDPSEQTQKASLDEELLCKAPSELFNGLNNLELVEIKQEDIRDDLLFKQKAPTFELEFGPNDLQSPGHFCLTVQQLVQKVLEVENVNPSLPGTVHIAFTVKTPLAQDGRDFVYHAFRSSSLFKDDICSASCEGKNFEHENSLKLQNVKRSYSRQLSELEIHIPTTKLRIIVAQVVFDVHLKGIPTHLLKPDVINTEFNDEESSNFYIEWTVHAPSSWKSPHNILERKSTVRSPFNIEYTYNEKPSIIHTAVPKSIFNNLKSFKSAVTMFCEDLTQLFEIDTDKQAVVQIDFLLLTGIETKMTKCYVKNEPEECRESDDDFNPTDDLVDCSSGSEPNSKKMKIVSDMEISYDQCLNLDFPENLQDVGKIQTLIPIWKNQIIALDKKIRASTNSLKKLEKPKATEFIRIFKIQSDIGILKRQKQKRRTLIKSYEAILNLEKSRIKDKEEAEAIIYTSDTLMCIPCKATSSEQILCWCKNCAIVLCDNCVTEHKKSTMDHNIEYPSDITVGYALNHQFEVSSMFGEIADIKFLGNNSFVLLNAWNEQLIICNSNGDCLGEISVDLENSVTLTPLVTENLDVSLLNQIAVIDESTVAVSLSKYMAVVLVDITSGIIARQAFFKRLTGGIAFINKMLLICSEEGIHVMKRVADGLESVDMVDVCNVKVFCVVDNHYVLCIRHNGDLSLLNVPEKQIINFATVSRNVRGIVLDDDGNIIFVDKTTIKKLNAEDINSPSVTCITLPPIDNDNSNPESIQICWASSLNSLVATRDRTVYVYKQN